MKVLQKIKNEVPCGPTIPPWGCIFKGDENGTWKRVFTLLSLLQYYLQQLRHRNNINVLWWMNKETVVYAYNGVLFSLKYIIFYPLVLLFKCYLLFMASNPSFY